MGILDKLTGKSKQKNKQKHRPNSQPVIYPPGSYTVINQQQPQPQYQANNLNGPYIADDQQYNYTDPNNNRQAYMPYIVQPQQLENHLPLQLPMQNEPEMIVREHQFRYEPSHGSDYNLNRRLRREDSSASINSVRSYHSQSNQHIQHNLPPPHKFHRTLSSRSLHSLHTYPTAPPHPSQAPQPQPNDIFVESFNDFRKHHKFHTEPDGTIHSLANKTMHQSSSPYPDQYHRSMPSQAPVTPSHSFRLDDRSRSSSRMEFNMRQTPINTVDPLARTNSQSQILDNSYQYANRV